jgi:hypothetical protein
MLVLSPVERSSLTAETSIQVPTIIVDSDRRKPAGVTVTTPEAEPLFRSMAAYAGTYTERRSASSAARVAQLIFGLYQAFLYLIFSHTRVRTLILPVKGLGDGAPFH